MKLSNQAKWYLTGLKATHTCDIKGTEPKAMQELIDAGLAKLMDNHYQQYYIVTDKGRAYDLNG